MKNILLRLLPWRIQKRHYLRALMLFTLALQHGGLDSDYDEMMAAADAVRKSKPADKDKVMAECDHKARMILWRNGVKLSART